MTMTMGMLLPGRGLSALVAVQSSARLKAIGGSEINGLLVERRKGISNESSGA